MNFNPQAMIQNLALSQLQQNPLFLQAQQMAQGKSQEELMQTCENLCRQKGINLQEALSRFQSQFPGMK